jgi:Tol biopolymer transport system component
MLSARGVTISHDTEETREGGSRRRGRRTVARLLGLALGTTLSLGASAATYDPDLRWRTIQTEHFNIHFHQSEEQLADEFSLMVEEVYDTMTVELRWEPKRRTELVLIDRTDSANGYASVVPYNAIVIYVTAPTEDSTLNLYEDWATAIFTHELTHILHMDTHHGIVSAARAVVGRIASTNDLSPWWMVEGLATFQETRHTNGGRGRAAWPDMIKRAAVVDDAFPPLGNLDGLQPNPPAGNLRYLFGQDFIDYIARTRGRDVWTRWTHTYGGHIPYILPSKKVFGAPLTRLYKEWRADMEGRYGAVADAVRAEGETIGRTLSLKGSSCIAPSFSPDGDWLVWSCYDPRRGSAIWRSDGEGYAAEILLKDRGAAYFTWRRDSQAFVYAGTHLVNRFNTWSDIYMYTMGSSGALGLTNGARARDPDFSPDGQRLLMVTNKASNNQLEVLTVDRKREALTHNTDHTQYGTPRWSPDGSVIALSVWQDGRRDLWLYTPDGQPARRITSDTAIDADPVWAPDGKTLFFTSDRSSIPNIYAIDLQTERLYQVTNVVNGAVKPTLHPGGELMAYQHFTNDGWEIHALDLDPAHYRDLGLLPRPVRYDTPMRDLVGSPVAAPVDAVASASVWEQVGREVKRWKPRALPGLGGVAQDPPADALDSFDDADVEDVFGQELEYPFQITPRRYNPLPTLLPRYVAPFIQTTTFPPKEGRDFSCLSPEYFCPSLYGTLSTGSSDTLRRFGWSGFLNYRTDADFVGGGAALTINRFLPVYSFGWFTAATSTARLAYLDPNNPLDADGNLIVESSEDRYWERRIQGYGQVSFPYRLRSSVFARYSLTQRRELDPLPEDVFLPAVPYRGLVGALSGGYRFSWAQQTAYSISQEDARTLSLVGAILNPLLGTYVVDSESGGLRPLSQVQLTAEVREYVVNPFLANHVLATRASTGLALGGTEFLGNYQLGGSLGDSAFYVAPDELQMLRGYPIGFDSGDMFWLASAEYRFPVWHIQRGIGALPFFARYLSAAAFVDAGNAFDSPTSVTGQAASVADIASAATTSTLVGVGGELAASSVVGWGAGIRGRVGYAVPLTVAPGAGTPYLRFGGSF